MIFKIFTTILLTSIFFGVVAIHLNLQETNALLYMQYKVMTEDVGTYGIRITP